MRLCGVERGPRLASRRHIGRRLAAPVGVWDADADGYRREFVAKAIVVDPYASGPPACADYVWAAKDELGGYLADDAYLEFLRKLL